MVTTTDTSTPNVTYVAAANAPAGTTDTITVTAYVAEMASNLVNAEQVGTAAATVTIQTTGLQNGNFTQGIASWSYAGNGSFQLNSSIYYGSEDCFPAQEGNQFAQFGEAGGQDAYLQQTFTMPSNATTLSVRSWDNLDPSTGQISLIVNGQQTVLGSFIPPSVQKLSDPNDYYSVVCTGNTSATYSYSIGSYAGKVVTLRIEAIGIPGGINGYFLSYDDVIIK
jgi:hypothetical protein